MAGTRADTETGPDTGEVDGGWSRRSGWNTEARRTRRRLKTQLEADFFEPTSNRSGVNSVEAMKRKIRVLQRQADEAEERAESLQRRVEKEKRTRKQAESEVSSLHRRIQLLEEDLERAPERAGKKHGNAVALSRRDALFASVSPTRTSVPRRGMCGVTRGCVLEGRYISPEMAATTACYGSTRWWNWEIHPSAHQLHAPETDECLRSWRLLKR